LSISFGDDLAGTHTSLASSTASLPRSAHFSPIIGTFRNGAAGLKISLGTVKSRLSRAHAALDRELSPVLDRHYIR
jgi:hypothetical protein